MTPDVKRANCTTETRCKLAKQFHCINWTVVRAKTVWRRTADNKADKKKKLRVVTLLLLLLLTLFDGFCAAVLTTVDRAFSRSLSGWTRWMPRRQSCRIYSNPSQNNLRIIIIITINTNKLCPLFHHTDFQSSFARRLGRNLQQCHHQRSHNTISSLSRTDK